jgi:ferredoxin-NADP reductase
MFCAGGIGISPILSQYREFLHHHRNNQPTNNNNNNHQVETTPKTTFLYSVSSEDELVFADELAKMSKPGCNRLIFTKTNSGTAWNENNVYETSDEFNHVEKKCGRRLAELINDAPVDAIYYICGPPSMIDDAVSQLNRKGVPSDSVKYEKWW